MELQSKIILCVDDDPDFLAYFLSASDPFNLTIDTSPTLKDALSKIGDKTYDAYIIDLSLPDGSGIDLIDTLRSKKKIQVPIAVISGVQNDEETFRRLKENYGVEYILEKPIFPQQIDQLLTNLCQRQSANGKTDKLQELKATYNLTISDKIALLTKLVHAAQASGSKNALEELKAAVHKIAGSAGTYGYLDVSECCKELEYEINQKLVSGGEVTQNWLMTLSDFLRNVKYHFQIISTSEETGNVVPYVRPSLYVIDDDANLLEQLKHAKGDQLLVVDSDPKEALERLNSYQFNPRVIIAAESFPGSTITGMDLIETFRNRERTTQHHTIFALLLSKISIETRIKALDHGIDYIFHKPIEAKTLLKYVKDVLEVKSLHSFKVLVVDDDEDVCNYISLVLSEIGIEVRTLCDPSQIFEVLEEYQPQMLLLDVLMPKYDGLSLLKTLRADAHYNHLIITIITLRAETEIQLAAYSANADDILYKPFDKTILQKRILSLSRRKVFSSEVVRAEETKNLETEQTLYDNVRERLAMPEHPPHYLVIVEMNPLDSLIQKHGQAEIQKQSAFISSMLLRLADVGMGCFSYGLGKFAIMFDYHHLQDVEDKMIQILNRTIHNVKIELQLNAFIMPIQKDIGDVQQIVHLAEEGLKANRNQSKMPIAIHYYGHDDQKRTSKQIVVIDPDEDLQKILQSALVSHHFDVKTYSHGKQALDDLLDHKRHGRPALIISERMLPDMDAMEILKKVQMHYKPPVPFFFLTFFSSEKDIKMGLQNGAADYFSKPFNLAIFIQKVLKTISLPSH